MESEHIAAARFFARTTNACTQRHRQQWRRLPLLKARWNENQATMNGTHRWAYCTKVQWARSSIRRRLVREMTVGGSH